MMASSCVLEPSQEKSSDNTLIVIVNSDGTVSVDPQTLQSVLENEKESTVSVVRLGKPIQHDFSSDSEEEDKTTQVNLTVEGFYSPCATTPQDLLDDGLDVLKNSLGNVDGETDEDHQKLSIIDPASDLIHVDHCYTYRLTNRQILQLSAGEVNADLQAQLEEQDALDHSAVRHDLASGLRGKAKTRGARGGKRDGAGRRGVAVVGDESGINAAALQHIALRPPPNSPASATLVPLTVVVPSGSGKQNVLQSSAAQVSKAPVKVLLSHGVPGHAAAGGGVVLARFAPITVHPQTVVVSENGQAQQQHRVIRIGPDGQVLSQPSQQVVMLVQGDKVPTSVSSSKAFSAPISKRGIPHLSVVRSRGRGGLRARGGRGSRGGRGGLRIHSEPLDQAMEDALNAMVSPEKTEDAPVSEADTEPYHQIKKSKVKVSKGRGDETNTLKPPRTYSKKIEQLQKSKVTVVTPFHEEKSEDALKAHLMKKAITSATIVPSTHTISTVTSVATSSLVSTPTSSCKKYPKRENRKPPAHLADAFSAELLFSTPDIIRRVSKTSGSAASSGGIAPEIPESINAADGSMLPAASVTGGTSEQLPQISSFEKNDGLAGIEPSLLDTIQTEVSKSEDELLADALLLEDLEGSIPVLELMLGEAESASDTGYSLQDTAMDSSSASAVVTILPNVALESSQVLSSMQQNSQTSVKSPHQKTDTAHTRKSEAKQVRTTSEITSGNLISGPEGTIKQNSSEKVESARRRKSSEKSVKSPRRKSGESHSKNTSLEPSEDKPELKLAPRRRSSSTKTFTENEDDISVEEEDEGQEEAASDDDSWNSEDDPERLWCICKKPHNNRFMICCDDCEDWFHGHCVGVTKAMGKKISEWKCPNCSTQKQDEKKSSPKGGRSPKKNMSSEQILSSPPPNKIKQQATSAITPLISKESTSSAKLKASKDTVHPKAASSKGTPKLTAAKDFASKTPQSKESAVSMKTSSKDSLSKSKSSNKDVTAQKQHKENAFKLSKSGVSKSSKDVSNKDVGGEDLGSSSSNISSSKDRSQSLCIKCKKTHARSGQMYCSDSCITQYAEEVLRNLGKPSSDAGKVDQRITVIEKKTGRIFASSNGPLASELCPWLLANPTFEVVQSSPLPNAKYYSTPVAGASGTSSSTSSGTAVLHRPHSTVKKKMKPASSISEQATPEQQLTLEQSKAAAVDAEIPVKPMKAKLSFQLPKTSQASQAQGKSQPSNRTDPSSKTPGSSTKPNASKPLKQTRLVLTPVTSSTTVPTSGGSTSPQVATPKPQSVQLQRQTSQKSESPKASVPSTPSSSSSSSSSKSSKKTDRKQSISEPTPRKLSTDEGPKEKEKEKEKDSGNKAEPIRLTVSKALQEALAARLKDCDDLKPADEILQKIAVSIEEEMFSFFKDTGLKYKAKYRSLMFNIKDPKNPTLFRRIADGSLPPSELVRLSAEELASQELARWREQQTQHQLEMIRKSELDLLQMAKSVVMKTHKGEQEIETETLAPVPDIDPNITVTDLVTALNDSVTSTTAEEAEKIDQRELTLKEREQERQKRERERVRRDDDDDRDNSRSSHLKHHKDRSDRHRSRKDKHHSRRKSRSKDHTRSRDRDKPRERSRSHSKSRRDSKSKEKNKSHKSSKDHSSKRKRDIKVESLDSAVVEKVVGVEPKREDLDVSDHEPSSTVTIKTPESSAEEHMWIDEDKAVWRGFAQMQDVARFYTALVPLSGDCSELDKELTDVVDCVGRISTEMAWDYIETIKKSRTKDIVLLRFMCSEDNEDQMKSYMKLFSYLSSRHRLGVVKVSTKSIKDFYIIPWAKNASLPSVLSFFDASVFGSNRSDLLLALVVWARRKRLSTDPMTIIAPQVSKNPRLSFDTPKVPIVAAPKPLAIVAEASERSYTPPLSKKPSRSPTVSPSRSPKVVIPLLGDVDDENVPYSPGEDSEDESERRKAELDRKIREETQRIKSLENAIVSLNPNIGLLDEEEDNDENKPYSPSRSFTPPCSPPPPHLLSTKSLLKVDPIVQNYAALDESPDVDEGPSLIPSDFSSSFFASPAPSTTPPLPAPKSLPSKSRDPRSRGGPPKSSLSDFSDEDLIRKAEQQLAETSPVSVPPPAVLSQPPPILSLPPPDLSKPPPNLSQDLVQSPSKIIHMPQALPSTSQTPHTLPQLPPMTQPPPSLPPKPLSLSQPPPSIPSKPTTPSHPPSKFSQSPSALPQPPPPGMEDDPTFFSPSYTTYPTSLPPSPAPIPLPPKPVSKPPPPPPEPMSSPPAPAPASELESPKPRRPQTPPVPASARRSRSRSASHSSSHTPSRSRSSSSTSSSDSPHSQRSRTRSKSRSRTRSKSRSRSRSRSRSQSPPATRIPRPPTPPRGKRRRSSLETEDDVAARKIRDHQRWKDRPPSPAEQEYPREKSSERSKERSRVRSRDSSGSQSRSISRDRSPERSPSRDRNRERDRPRDRNRDRERSWDYRERDRDRDRDWDRDRDRDRWETREQFSHRDQHGHQNHPSGHPGSGLGRGRGRGWVDRGKFRGPFRGFFRGGRGHFRGHGRPSHPQYHGDIQDHSQFEGDIRNFEEKQRERTLKIKRKEMKAKKPWN